METAQQNFLDVFKKLSLNLDTKIDDLHSKEISKLTQVEINIEKLKGEINKKEVYNKSLPRAVGIDLTIDTSELQSELKEQQRLLQLRNNYFTFVREKESLKIAFAPVNSLILNKQVFYDLVEYFGLMRIYQTENQENLYVVAGNHERDIKQYHEHATAYKETFHKELDNYKNAQNVINKKSLNNKVNRGIITAVIGVLSYLFISSDGIQTALNREAGIFIGEATIYSLLFIAITSFITFKITSLFFQKPPVLVEPKERELQPVVKKIFPNNEIRSQNVQGNGTWTYFKITLPKPPELIRENIINTLRLVGKMQQKGVQCTVADPLAIGLEVVRTQVIGPPPIPPRLVDPGIVIEYGQFAVILPETFYHITNAESQFLDESLQIGEKWDAKKYLMN